MKGSMVERRPGRWRLRVHVGKGANGKPRYAHKTFTGGKREAATALAGFVGEVTGAGPGASHDGRITLRKFAEAWLNGRTIGVGPRTIERYRELAEHQILPALGHMPLRTLSYLDIERAYAQMLKTGRRDGAGCSPQTVLHAHRLLHQIGKAAAKAGHIATNPVALATPPRIEQKTPPVLGDLGKVDYLAAYAGDRMEVAAILLLSTGMRRGELLGLTWQEGAAEFEAGRLVITQTIQQVRERDPAPGKPKTRIVILAPKTKAGRRTLRLAADAIEGLRAHRLRQREECLRNGWPAPTFLFTSPETGKVWRPSKFSQAFGAVAAAKGLHVWPHLLRHTNLTDLLADNIHPKIAQARAGHTRVSTTLDLYSHVSEAMQETAVATTQNVLRRAAAARKP